MKTINFLKHKNIILAISIVVVLAGIIYGIATDYVFDIDFKGGTRIKVDLNEEYVESDIKDIVSGITSKVPEIQTSSSGNNTITITTQTLSEDESSALIAALEAKYTNIGDPTIRNVQASYGKELFNTAIIAGIVSIVLLLVYVAVRFRTLGYAAAFSAVLGLIFDVCFLFAIYGIFKFPINSTFVAVLLTIVGYSINDTFNICSCKRSRNFKTILNSTINRYCRRNILFNIYRYKYLVYFR